MIYAVDFDGYLCADAWPEIGKPNTKIIDHFKALKADGHKLILWTCREDEALHKAVAWCATHGLYFDAHNVNLPERIFEYGGDCRKISADYYCDDRNYWLTAEEQMTIKEYLRQAPNLDKRIDAKLEQIERLKSLRERVTVVLSDMPKANRQSDRMMEITVRIMELENEVNSDIDNFIDIKSDIRKLIGQVKDERYQRVLEYRYLCGYRWEDIAREMKYELRWIHRLHGQALLQVSHINAPIDNGIVYSRED